MEVGAEIHENPKTDNEQLFNLQDRHKAGDPAALGLMYLQCRRIAVRMIKKERSKKGFYISQEDVKEKAHNAATYIITRYKKKSDFVIIKSFTAYIHLRVRHELYYWRKVDGIVDFVDLEKFEKKS